MPDLPTPPEYRSLPVSTLRSLPGTRAAGQTGAQRLPSSRAVRRRAESRRFVALTNLTTAVELLDPLPAADETIHGLMGMSLDAWSLVRAVIQLGGVCRELTIATLGFSDANTAALSAALDEGRLSKVTFIVSTYFRAIDRKVFEGLHSALTTRGQGLFVRRSHAKLCLFDMSDGRKFTIESSANLRSCKNVEQFSLTQSPELFGFHRSWITDLIATGHDK